MNRNRTRVPLTGDWDTRGPLGPSNRSDPVRIPGPICVYETARTQPVGYDSTAPATAGRNPDITLIVRAKSEEPQNVYFYSGRNERLMDVLYIDLLKRVLTNTLFQEEPDINEEEHRFVAAFLKHYIRSPAITMLPMARLHNIDDCVTQVVTDGIPGDLIETGVWRGGATILMRALLKVFNETARKVWVADSFEGLPEPSADEFPIEAKSYGGPVMEAYDRFAAPLELVKRNFEAFGFLDDQVQFLPGWFKDTLSTAPIDRLAVMRLDGDYYSSTMDALTALYDKLSVGGFVIIDDYGEDRWTYCRKAVDEFRDSRGIADPLVQVDLRCSFWRRTS